MQLKQTEKEIENSILEYLYYFHLGYFWKNNSVGIFDPTKKIFRKSKNKYAVNGVADIIGCIDGKFVSFEVKSEAGKQLPDQKEFQKNIEHAHGKYAVVKSINEVIQYLKVWFPNLRIPQ